jgi:hypothetical protein
MSQESNQQKAGSLPAVGELLLDYKMLHHCCENLKSNSKVVFDNYEVAVFRILGCDI